MLSGDEDAAVFSLFVFPVGHSAVDSLGTAHPHAVERIEIPQNLAGSGVESANLQLGGGDVHDAVDDEGRAFDRRRGTIAAVARVMSPSDLQIRDVGAVDAVQPRVPRRFLVSSVIAPVGRQRARPAAACLGKAGGREEG